MGYMSSLESSIVAICGNLVFSKKQVYAYYKLPSARFDFASRESKVSAALALDNLLSSLSSSASKDLECHLLVICVPIDVDAWETGLNDAMNRVTRVTGAGERFIAAQAEILRRAAYTTKQVFLGVELGSRSDVDGEASLNPIIDTAKTVQAAIDKMLVIKDSYISPSESAVWEGKENSLNIAMNSATLKCERATSSEIAGVLMRIINPNPTFSPPPSIERYGEGALIGLVDSRITEKSTHLEIEYPDSDKQYQASLVFSAFPTQLEYPNGEPWIYAVQILCGSAVFSSRFKLIPPGKVAKQLGVNIKRTQDELNNAASVGQVSLDLTKRARTVELLEYRVKNSNQPWVFGTHQITVTRGSEKELKSDLSTLTQYFHQKDVVLSRPLGNQYDLLLQAIPGDHIRVKDYIRKQTLPIIGTGMPHGTSDTGDRIEFQ